jgi:hypothetical protein
MDFVLKQLQCISVDSHIGLGSFRKGAQRLMCVPPARRTRPDTEASSIAVTHRCTRPTTHKTSLLDKHRDTAELPHALKGQFTRRIFLVGLVLKTYQEVVSVSYPPRHHTHQTNAMLRVQQHLRVILGRAKPVKVTVSRMVVEHNQIGVLRLVKFA